MISVIVAVEDF